MILGQRHPDADDPRPAPQVGIVLPFGARRPDATSPDGRWETVARIPAVRPARPTRPTRPSEEPTLELPVVRIHGAPDAEGPVPVPNSGVHPGAMVFVGADDPAGMSRPEFLHAPAAGSERVDRGRGRWRDGGVWWHASGRSPGGPAAVRPGDRVRVQLAALAATMLELVVALLRLLIDGVTMIYRILQRFGPAAVVVSLVLVALRMFPWAEIASFLHALSAPP